MANPPKGPGEARRMARCLVASRAGVPVAFHVVQDSGDVGSGASCAFALPGTALAERQATYMVRDGRLMLHNQDDSVPLLIKGRVSPMGTIGAGEAFQLGDLQITLIEGSVPEAKAVPSATVDPATGLAEIPPDLRELEALFFLAHRFETLSTRESLLDALVERLQTFFRAERAAILEGGEGKKAPRPVLVRDRRHTGADPRFSETVVGRVLSTGEAMLVMDTEKEQSLDEAKSLRQDQVRSVICAPLVLAGSRSGVVYLDSSMVHRVFTEKDRDLLARFTGNASKLLAQLEETAELRHDVRTMKQLEREENPAAHELAGMVFESEAMRWVMEQVRLVAAGDSTVLVLGESGTGKELVARAIHHLSPRTARCFVPVNVMALPESVVESELFGHEKGAYTGATERRIGRFEMAQGGTLFLDEIGELSPALQVKLLRVLESRVLERVGSAKPISIDARIVAATNVEFEKLIREGRFREDLYYRLNVFSIRIPPLRERPVDIPVLVDSFVRHFSRTTGKAIRGADAGTMERLVSYPWPGNVRELRNVIERAFVLEQGPWLTPRCLPFDTANRSGAGAPPPGSPAAVAPPAPAGDPVPRIPGRLPRPAAPPAGAAGGAGPGILDQERATREKTLILACLERNQGNVTRAAQELGISRKTLYRRLRDYGMAPEGEE